MIEPSYVEGPAGKLFFTFFRPATEEGRSEAVLCLPPFGEELNKSRRMLAAQCRALAERGMPCLLPDLFGTGDSEGDFAAATWHGWCKDALFAADWLGTAGFERLNFLALRAGGLLLASVLDRIEQGVGRVALWAPVLQGEKMLSQFFRTRLVATMQQGSKSTTAEIRDDVRRAGTLEIAGYPISYELVSEIDGLHLTDVRWQSGQELLWLDATPVAADRVPAGAARIHAAWRQAGSAVDYHRVRGAQFWMGPEIEEVPDFLALTTEFLS